jgi:hypothetical protein
MSKNNKTPGKKAAPREGIRTHYDPLTEAHIRAEAKRRGVTVQEYLRDLARADRYRRGQS